MPSESPAARARAITRAGSLSTFLIIRWLADADLADDAFRAYAYFRWIDDMVDGEELAAPGRTAFLARQRQLLACALRGARVDAADPEEHLLSDLLGREHTGHPGLRSYLIHVMAVIDFDVRRRGQTVAARELATYSRNLSMAVMGGLSYFVGHHSVYPATPERLLAASGAHIIHMLRDAAEDVRAGYYNVPREFLEAHRLAPDDLQSPAYAEWVRQRLVLARRCLARGRGYILSCRNLRVRLAGLAYTARFLYTLRKLEAKAGLRPAASGIPDFRLTRSPGARVDETR
ncbi:MAG TPA: squalene/phytoene synthase family protein [Anaerolineales bacterium]|nr:squalene/phytoene synthase family protein [Anaerolineales bacterium]